MPQFHIDSVVPKESVYPMIVNFQNAYVNNNFTTSHCCLLQNEETGKKAVATELSDMIYSGEEENEDLSKTFILAQDKHTGKVRIIEVGSVEMKPVIKTKLDVSQVLETSNLELNRKFGSKKSKKVVEQREKLKMNVETVTEQMSNITQSVTKDMVDISSYSKTLSLDEMYLPPINREATRVEDVYEINSMLSEDDYENIYSELEDSNCMKNLSDFFKYFPIEKLTRQQQVLLIYANALMNFIATPVSTVDTKSYFACPYSGILNDVIFTKFTITGKTKRLRPFNLRDKALCHAIVFTLLINNFKFDFKEFCYAFKLTPTNIQNKVTLIGASVVGLGSKKQVQLKLPLAKITPGKKYVRK